MSRLSLGPPRGAQLVPPEAMTRDQRAEACWLALVAGWPLIPDTWAFDRATNAVIVCVPQRGEAWGPARDTADVVLERIERLFRGNARARAEEVVG